MSNDSPQQPSERTIHSILESGDDGAAQLGRLAARSVAEPSVRDLMRAEPSPQMTSKPVPVSQLLSGREARKTNEHLAELLRVAKADVEEQRKVAERERAKARWSMIVAVVAGATAVLSLALQIVTLIVAR